MKLTRVVMFVALSASGFAASPAHGETSFVEQLRRAIPAEATSRGIAIGAWSPVINWGQPGAEMVPIHATLIAQKDPATGIVKGKVFTFGYYGVPDFYLWDPETGAFEQTADLYPIPINRNCAFTTNPTVASFFCSGHSLLPDGRVLITGGNIEDPVLECPKADEGTQRGAVGHGSFAFAGAKFAHVFNPQAPLSSSFARQPDMRDGRWYPSNLALPDGRVMVVSGLGECSYCAPGHTGPVTYTNADIEVYTPSAAGLGSWQILGFRELPLYPNLHVLTDGRIFYAGPGSDSHYYSLGGGWNFTAWSNYPFRGGGSFVPMPGQPNKIMLVGGGCCGPWSSTQVEIIDLNVPSPQWQIDSPLNIGREYADAVLLPDRTIVITGGRRNTWDNVIGDAVYAAEIYDPEDPDGDPSWEIAASAARPRMYHSTALLLPDGSVWTGGGTAEGAHSDQPSAEIFYPPYYFAPLRPHIASTAKRISYDQRFRVATPNGSSITSVILIKPGSTTHAVNMEQRLVDLSFTRDAATGDLLVRAPLNGNHAPPGYYMLFIVDSNRRPSVATFVRLRSAVCPDCPGDMNCDGVVSVGDIAGFVLALTNPAGYQASFSACDRDNADINADGQVSVTDIAGFVTLLVGG